MEIGNVTWRQKKNKTKIHGKISHGVRNHKKCDKLWWRVSQMLRMTRLPETVQGITVSCGIHHNCALIYMQKPLLLVLARYTFCSNLAIHGGGEGLESCRWLDEVFRWFDRSVRFGPDQSDHFDRSDHLLISVWSWSGRQHGRYGPSLLCRLLCRIHFRLGSGRSVFHRVHLTTNRLFATFAPAPLLHPIVIVLKQRRLFGFGQEIYGTKMIKFVSGGSLTPQKCTCTVAQGCSLALANTT